MNNFLCMWNIYGLETVIDITEYEHVPDEQLLEMIQTGNPARKSEFDRIYQALLIRAKVNSHRNYEIYAIQTTEHVSVADIKKMFETDPQASADLIRNNGVKIFSNRNAAPVIV